MEPGRRERKKNQTRKAIAEAAARLFGERGFESVTIAEIADAADVATGTVFNYFRSKEELCFDLGDDFLDALTEAVRDRPYGESAVDAFRRWQAERLDFVLHPRAHARLTRFFRIVADSPALTAYEPLLYERYQVALGAALDSGGDPVAELLAAQLVALHRALLRRCRELVLRGDGADAMREDVRVAESRAFALLSDEAKAWGSAT